MDVDGMLFSRVLIAVDLRQSEREIKNAYICKLIIG